jgi:hypothetical protein
MPEATKTFQVNVKGFNKSGLVISFNIPVVATTKWHAIELAYSKYCRVQPNRNLYSAK